MFFLAKREVIATNFDLSKCLKRKEMVIFTLTLK